MTRWLAAICFCVALGLVCRGMFVGADFQADEREELKAGELTDFEGARSTSRQERGKRVAVVTKQQREAAMELLTEAVHVKPVAEQAIIWSEENFKYHLSKLTSDDAKILLEELFSKEDKTAVQIFTGSLSKNWIFDRNHSKLVEGLVGMLSRADFRDTLTWLESVDLLKEDRQLADYVYDHVLVAGANQDPYEAWQIYKKKCIPGGG